MVGLLLLVGCSSNPTGEEGAAGAASIAGGEGGASPTDLGEGGAQSAAGGASGAGSTVERYCRIFLDYQDAGGFWCSRDGETIEETDTTEGCLHCYLVTCDIQYTRWVPVWCSELD